MEDVFNIIIIIFFILIEKKSFSLKQFLLFQDVLKTSWNCLEDVLKTAWKMRDSYTEDVFKTSSKHVLKTSLIRQQDQGLFYVNVFQYHSNLSRNLADLLYCKDKFDNSAWYIASNSAVSTAWSFPRRKLSSGILAHQPYIRIQTKCWNSLDYPLYYRRKKFLF